MRPVLFEVFGLPVNSYGALVGLGAFGAFLLARRLSRGTPIAPTHLLDLTVISVVAGVVGGRLMYVFLHWEDYAGDLLSIFRIWEQGLTSYGAMLGIIAGLLIYARRAKLPVWTLLDLSAAPFAFVYAFGRIGCFMAGCCHGASTDVAWACAFPYAENYMLREVPVHPTQLYAAGINFVFCAWLAQIWHKRKFDGQVFFAYLMLYACYRVIVEFFRRGATSNSWLAGLTPAQWAAIFLFVIAATAYVLKQRGTAGNGSTAQGADSN